MTWVVITRDSYETWRAGTDEEHDAELRMNVLGYLLSLQDDGPPAHGTYDSFRNTWEALIPGTNVVMEYVVAPFLDPPAIAIRRYR